MYVFLRLRIQLLSLVFLVFVLARAPELAAEKSYQGTRNVKKNKGHRHVDEADDFIENPSLLKQGRLLSSDSETFYDSDEPSSTPTYFKKDDIAAAHSRFSWVEETDESGPINEDFYFDRVVFIITQQRIPITTGIFITNKRILTSYNPYRHNHHPQVSVLIGRTRTENGKKNVLSITDTPVECLGRVHFVREETLHKTQWHGTDRRHSPLVDLAVLRIRPLTPNHNFLDPNPALYSGKRYPLNQYIRAGPIITPLARKNNELSGDLKFASIAFRNKWHVKRGVMLSSREYAIDDNVLDDCNELFPKTWGRYFICLRNIDNYIGVGSGAILISNNTLFGIGSFSLRKGNFSYLVFTDVRPYYWPIVKTCYAQTIKWFPVKNANDTTTFDYFNWDIMTPNDSQDDYIG